MKISNKFVWLLLLLGNATLHSFVTPASYNIWKKNIDNLANDKPATAPQVWENFILIEGGFAYDVIYGKNPTTLTKHYVETQLPENVQWTIRQQIRIANQAPAVQKSPLEIATELIDTISNSTAKVVAELKKLDTSKSPLIGSLQSAINTGNQAIDRLEKLYTDNQKNQQLIKDIQKKQQEKNIEIDMARKILQNAEDTAQEIKKHQEQLASMEKVINDRYEAIILESNLNKFIKHVLAHSRNLYGLYSDPPTSAQKTAFTALISTYENHIKAVAQELAMRLKIFAFTNKNLPSSVQPYDWTYSSSIDEDTKKEALRDKLIESLEAINLTDQENYERSRLNFEQLIKSFAHTGQFDERDLCKTILSILETLWKEHQN